MLPADQLLRDAGKSRALTLSREELGGHALRPPRIYVEQRSPFHERGPETVWDAPRDRSGPAACAVIRVMDEPASIGCQLARELSEICVDDIRLGVNERVEAEYEINRAVLDHLQRSPVVDVVGDVVGLGEALPAVVDALRGQVDDEQPLAEVLQILGPPAVSRGDLQDGPGRDEGVDPGKQGPVPQGRGPAPRG